MRYLTLSADYLWPQVLDESNRPVPLEELELSSELYDQIVAWNSRYQSIIPLDSHERAKFSDLIHQLDDEGLLLRLKLQEEIAPAKVSYYSEGRLQNL